VTDEARLFIPITKIDIEKRQIYGTITEEAVDRSGEVFDYKTSKPYYEKWSNEISEATQGKSVGNLRAMHQLKVAGKLVQLDMNDQERRISCVAEVVDDDEWRLCLAGAYTGFSHGGRYVARWADGDVTRYTINPIETSLVDSPNLPSSRFKLVKADGTEEEREFKPQASQPNKEAVTPPANGADPEEKPAEQAATKTAGDPPNTQTPVEGAVSAEPSPEAEKVAASTTGDGTTGMTEEQYLARVQKATGLDQSRTALLTGLRMPTKEIDALLGKEF